MNTPQTWLLGSLADHARGAILTDALSASPAHLLPPDYGICIAFGSDFQSRDVDSQHEWTAWAELAGRTLLLIPPFRIGECTVPVKWRIYRPQIKETDSVRLAKLLAGEVRYELAGALQTATDIGGQWKGGGVNTAYYRKHPHAGLFALTCLPIWSLSVLDHRDDLAVWLSTLHALSGQAVVDSELRDPSTSFQPGKDHFAMMLHLCPNRFSSPDEAIAALADSPVLALPRAAATQCIQQLEAAGFSEGGQLTEAGRDVLFGSPYASYAAAMMGGAE